MPLNNEVFRPIHYLGSKYRILDLIKNTIDEIDPEKGEVCDLFSGSGSVSFFLSQDRAVTAIDIQEYSRVICSAVLSDFPDKPFEADTILEKISNSGLFNKYFDAARELISTEECLIEHNNNSVPTLLLDGSLIKYELGEYREGNYFVEIFERFYNKLNLLGINKNSIVIFRYYGGIYFSYKQALAIDIILNFIKDYIPKKFKDFYLAPLLSSVSDSVNTVGKQFAQPLNPLNSKGELKKSIITKLKKDRFIDVFSLYSKWLNKYCKINKPIYSNKIFKSDFNLYLDELPDSVNVVYADPPYTRDHYSRFYHVLETIALGDEPLITTNKVNKVVSLSKGIYRDDRHQSPFCIKKQAEDAFRKLFEKVSAKNKKLVLSYSPYDEDKQSHPRVVRLNDLLIIARGYFDNVEIRSAGQFVHSKLNSSDKHLEASEQAEILIVCY